MYNYYWLDTKYKCYSQSAPLEESRAAIRDGPQRNEEWANLALSFYKSPGLTQA